MTLKVPKALLEQLYISFQDVPGLQEAGLSSKNPQTVGTLPYELNRRGLLGLAHGAQGRSRPTPMGCTCQRQGPGVIE